MNYILALTFALLAVTGCGTTEPQRPATYLTDTGDGSAADGGTSDTFVSAQDTGATSPDTQSSSQDSAAFPDGYLEPIEPDASAADSNELDTSTEPDTSVGGAPVGKLYAHTATELYQLDLATQAIVKKGTFTFDKNKDKITDIALDKFGKLYAIGFDHVFTCQTQTAACTWLASLPSSFNGMTFVPEGVLDPTQDVLVGISSQGDWTRITINGSKVQLKKLGYYGDGWLSSGDAFSVVGVGTFATLKGKGSSDSLARIDPATGKIVKIIGETGAVGLFGLAWWAGEFYAFSKTGSVYTLDIQTGKATEVKSLAAPNGVSWWGAGVSTRANGL